MVDRNTIPESRQNSGDKGQDASPVKVYEQI